MTRAEVGVSDVLVGRRLDGWLTGWIAVALWMATALGNRVGHPFPSLGIPWYWPAMVVSAAHFGMSYRLAYAAPTGGVRPRRPAALTIAPMLLAGVLVALIAVTINRGPGGTRGVTAALITTVYLLTTWHYIKQVYGIARLAARYRGVTLQPVEAGILRYGLYPLWFIGAAKVFTTGSVSRFGEYRLGLDLAPRWTLNAARFVAVICAIAIAVVIVRATRRCATRPSSLMIAPYAAGFLWIAFPTDYFAATFALGGLHGLQYLACCYRAESARTGRALSLFRWTEMLAAAACGGLIMTAWLPGLLSRTFGGPSVPSLFAAAFFVFLNLHHYLIDAVIWRSSGDIVRAMTRRPSPRPQPEPVLV